MHLKNIAHNLIRPRIHRGRFANHQKVSQFELSKLGDSLSRRVERRAGDASPRRPIPVEKLTRKRLLAAPDNTVYRLGHSSVLLKLQGEFWLTDPVFCERVYAAAEDAGVHLVTPRMGQALSLDNPPGVDFWWRELMDTELVEESGQGRGVMVE